MNKNQIENAAAHNLSSAPSNPAVGQEYFNTSDKQKYIWDGTAWVSETGQGTTYTEGTGIDITGSTIAVDFTAVATAAQGALADTSLQPNDNITELTNNAGYQANVIETIKVNGTAQTVTSKAVNISVPTNNNQLTNGAGYITGINSSDVTTALGYTPYNSTNPSGYQTASDVSTAISGKADSATTLAGYGITDAYTKTEIDNKFQYVTEMPASPVEGVTYFILEDDEEEE